LFFLSVGLVVPPPTVDDLKHALAVRLQALKPDSVTRTVIFEDVHAGRAKGASYPFEVTATVRDSAARQTCVGRLSHRKLVLKKGQRGEWVVVGILTASDVVCRDNPRVESPTAPTPSLDDDAGNLPAGEWACYGVDGVLKAELSFLLKPNGTYTDLDGEREGRWVYSATKSEIAFRGGIFAEQTGTNVQSSGFTLSATVTCEPKK
jgi:hypothetical protein